MRELLPFVRLLGARGGWLIAGAVLMLLTIAANIGLLALSGWFITATGLAGLTLAAGAAMQLDIYRPSAGIRFFAIGRALSRYAERLVNHEAVLRVLADLRLWLFRRLLPLDTGTLARLRDGALLNRLTADIDALDHLYLRVLGPLAVAALALAGGLLLIAFLAPALVFPIAAALLPAAIAATWLTARAAGRTAAALAELGSRQREQLVSDLQAQAELHVFGAAAHHQRRLAALDQERRRYQRRLAAVEAIGRGLVLLGTLAALWLALQVGLAEVTAAALAGPLLAAALFVVLALGESITPLPQAMLLMGRVRWSARRISELAASAPAVTAPRSPQPVPSDPTLVFEAVTFRYRSGQTPCLQGLELTLRPGERLAILGPSGSGKSSLLSLALREVDPEDGCVRLGGYDLRRLDPDALQRVFAWLPQRTTLFAGSVAMNLRLAADGLSDAQLWAILDAVGLAEPIRRLPYGLDSHLGEGGAGLSGGQARRLALARTLLKPAPIVLLDEPTEGLDQETERAVLAGIEPWLRNRSLIVVAHDRRRLPWVDHCLELRDGVLRRPRTLVS